MYRNILVIFPIVTSGAALIFAGAAAGTSILPTISTGVQGVLGLGMNPLKFLFPLEYFTNRLLCFGHLSFLPYNKNHFEGSYLIQGHLGLQLI